MSQINSPSGLLQLMGFPSHQVDAWDVASDLKVDWQAVNERLDSHPEEAQMPLQQTDSSLHPQSPLELALLNFATPVPKNVLSSFLKAHPESLCRRTLAFASASGQTSSEALNYILDSAPAQLSESIAIQFLPEAVEMENIDTVRALVTRTPNSLFTTSGNLLSKELLDCGRSDIFFERLQLLLREATRPEVGGPEWAKGLLDKDEHQSRKSVMDIAIELIMDHSRDYGWATVPQQSWDILTTCIEYVDRARCCEQVSTTIDNSSSNNNNNDCPTFVSAVGLVPNELLNELLRIYSLEMRKTQNFRSLFSAEVFWMFFNKAINVSTLQRKNKYWRDVLHKTLTQYSVDSGELKDDSNNQYWKNLFRKVMTMNSGRPNATDGQGRLPLHVAAFSGLKWQGGLEEILKADFSALEQRDEVRGMLPHELASAGPEADSTVVYWLMQRQAETTTTSSKDILSVQFESKHELLQ